MGQILSYKLTNGHNNDTVDALTRMISTALRHGADISYVVQQLEKTQGGLVSFSKVMARTLKKYATGVVSGECCPQCGSENALVRQDGCKNCKQCGYSACS